MFVTCELREKLKILKENDDKYCGRFCVAEKEIDPKTYYQMLCSLHFKDEPRLIGFDEIVDD